MIIAILILKNICKISQMLCSIFIENFTVYTSKSINIKKSIIYAVINFIAIQTTLTLTLTLTLPTLISNEPTK